MIILSRNRIETAWDTQVSETLATDFGVPVLSVPFLYDLRSFGPAVTRLREISEPTAFIAPLPIRATKCLLGTLISTWFGKQSDSPRFIDSRNETIDDVVRILSGKISRTGHPGRVERLDEPTVKRWYPVIDKSRCTGCLECVNFCLFGVYVIGDNDFPLVDQPDACRDGCPACSRVCPRRAILFPMHEDGEIAGDAESDGFRMTADTAQAEEERKRHGAGPTDGLDDLVDRIDRFLP